MTILKQSINRLIQFLQSTFAGALILVCAGFSAAGIYMITHGNQYGWLNFLFFGGAAAFLVREIVSSRRRRKEVRVGGAHLSNEDLERANREEEITVELVKAFTPDAKPDEPAPPWIKYPHLSAFDIGWRMGAGEGYIGSEFGPFWMTLDQEQREDYFRRYDLGEEWPDRTNWYVSWVDYDVDNQ